MEYSVVIKKIFNLDDIVLQLSGIVPNKFSGFGSCGWPQQFMLAPVNFSAALSPPTSALSQGFSMLLRPTYENADYALYSLSAKGGQEFDYYVIGPRTLIYDRQINWAFWESDGLDVTAAQLKAICPPATLVNINKHITPLNAAMRKYKINTRLRQAHFLAQVAKESDAFKTAREYASGAAYEGRADLGNTQKGDGVRFRGRGLIQLTGRKVYTDYGQYVGKDFTTDTTKVLLEEEPAAADSAGWFWLIFKKGKDINARADRDDVAAVTRAVNGGSNGLADRHTYTTNAKKVFGITALK